MPRFLHPLFISSRTGNKNGNLSFNIILVDNSKSNCYGLIILIPFSWKWLYFPCTENRYFLPSAFTVVSCIYGRYRIRKRWIINGILKHRFYFKCYLCVWVCVIDVWQNGDRQKQTQNLFLLFSTKGGERTLIQRSCYADQSEFYMQHWHCSPHIRFV